MFSLIETVYVCHLHGGDYGLIVGMGSLSVLSLLVSSSYTCDEGVCLSHLW